MVASSSLYFFFFFESKRMRLFIEIIRSPMSSVGSELRRWQPAAGAGGGGAPSAEATIRRRTSSATRSCRSGSGAPAGSEPRRCAGNQSAAARSSPRSHHAASRCIPERKDSVTIPPAAIHTHAVRSADELALATSNAKSAN